MNKIYWYKLETHFGPGHQATEIRYFFEQIKLKKEYLKDYATEEADSVSRRFDCSAYTTVISVRKPPQEVIEKMRSDARGSIARGKYMLSILKDL